MKVDVEALILSAMAILIVVCVAMIAGMVLK